MVGVAVGVGGSAWGPPSSDATLLVSAIIACSILLRRRWSVPICACVASIPSSSPAILARTASSPMGVADGVGVGVKVGVAVGVGDGVYVGV